MPRANDCVGGAALAAPRAAADLVSPGAATFSSPVSDGEDAPAGNSTGVSDADAGAAGGFFFSPSARRMSSRFLSCGLGTPAAGGAVCACAAVPATSSPTKRKRPWILVRIDVTPSARGTGDCEGGPSVVAL